MGTSAQDVNQAAVEGLADDVVHAVIDGYYSDDSGIGQALRGGAVEIVAYLDTDRKNLPWDLVNLFTGPFVLEGESHESQFPVFREQAASILTQYEAFPKLNVSSGAKFLNSISVGTVQAVTVDSKLWGIPGGRAVTLHVVGVSSLVSIGGLNSFYNYDLLTQEVIETIVSPENAQLVQDVLMPWFLPSLGRKIVDAMRTDFTESELEAKVCL